MHAHARMIRKRALARQKIRARDYGSYTRVRTRIFTNFFLVINSYLMNLNFKFRQDPSFRWGDISLFVTVYDFDLNPIHHGGGTKCPDQILFVIAIFLVGNMPLNFLTFLKLPLWSSRKKPERSIFLGLIVAARQSLRTPFSHKQN